MSIIDKVDGRNYITFNGETKSVPDWARQLNLSVRTLLRRAEEGRPVEEVLGSSISKWSRAGIGTLHLSMGDVTLSITEWAERLDVPRERLYSRYRRGMSVAEILRPERLSQGLDTIEFNGQTRTLAEWANFLGVPYSVIYRRHQRGLPIEKVLNSHVQKKRILK